MQILGAVIAGFLLATTLPPRGWWILGPVGAAVLVTVIAGQPWPGRLKGALAASLAFYVPTLAWMAEFSVPGYALTVLLEAVILTAALMAVPSTGAGLALGFPGALVMAEAVRGAWPFGGFPLGGLDLGQVDGPLAHAARVGGHLTLVALVGLAGVALAAVPAVLANRQRSLGSRFSGEAVVAAAVAAVVVALPLLGMVAPDGSGVGELRVAAVQGGGQRGLRAAAREPQTVFDGHLAASEGVKDSSDLVVWPEDVVDIAGDLAGSQADSELGGLAQILSATVVAGVVEDAGPGRFRNAAVAWSPDGAQVARYDKVRRVPFGEYVPARSFFDRFADLSDVPQDAIPGRGAGLLPTPAGPLGVVISYEVFFADRARAAVEAGGRLLLVPTNAASFEGPDVPAQELAAARLRAIETGRGVIQAAPTGYTAVINHRGDVAKRTSLGQRGILHEVVEMRTGRTVASRLGDAPVVLAAGAALAVPWLLAWKRRRKVEHPRAATAGARAGS